MSTRAMLFRGGPGWCERLVLTVVGLGVLAVLGLLVFIAVKVGQNTK
jgi:hypothetical protein